MIARNLSYWRTGNPGERCLGATLLGEDEVRRVLLHLRGAFRLLGELMYETGIRLEELLALRVGDIDLARRELLVRDSRRVARGVSLSARLTSALERHLEALRSLHEEDLAAGGGGAALTRDVDDLYPLAGRRWCWQFVFPAEHRERHPRTGRMIRVPLDGGLVHRIMAEAGRAAGLAKPVHTHSLRHAFAARLVCRSIRPARLQRLMGHANLSTTEQYIEVLRAAMDGTPRVTVPAAADAPDPSRWPSRPSGTEAWSGWLEPLARCAS